MLLHKFEPGNMSWQEGDSTIAPQGGWNLANMLLVMTKCQKWDHESVFESEIVIMPKLRTQTIRRWRFAAEKFRWKELIVKGGEGFNSP